jgi:ABC-type Fe3+-siderophore transport system permease subunit
MGDFCMKALAQIVSGIGYIVGTVISILPRVTSIIDDSITIVAGFIGVIAGIIWVLILATKKKREKIELEIKEIELKKLKADDKL